ncbi:MAG TPA: PSD1 and planctomycete cytochrome C domain-containing protein [Gemmataceae bacterium]|nr:PSD1 and planctomycete cytochrome C domain-containing protein [Gemmataceae bacterium]
MKPWPFVATLLLLHASALGAAEPGTPLRFERDIQPLLTRCVTCHGTAKARGGLRLDNKGGATAVLDSGDFAVVPGEPEKSELLRRVRSTDPSEQMPPKGERLTAEQADRLQRWIAEGAVWPAHWAYRALTRGTPPTNVGGSQNSSKRTPIDGFIQAELHEHGLAPAPEADKATLLRRLTFDLTGLPPTPAQQAAFLADTAPDAYQHVVDRLLASPHYGERWARHWMDVVHFAETHGNDQDRPREHAWPYRDYLIRAFNQDTPYARFLQEQIAGDALFKNDPWALVATGFLAAGPWDESSLRDIREDSIDREIGRYLDRDDIVSTAMGTFASTTAHCARCHDHKFDPISQKEYYGLQAVFAGTDKANRAYDPDPRVAARRRQLNEQQARLKNGDKDLEALLGDLALQEELSAWERKLIEVRRRWLVLEPSALRSTAGTILTPLADGSILATGPRPDKDTYTVVAHLGPGPVTAIRLELLTDGSLPNRGPGRQENGNLHLSEFSVMAATREGGKQSLAWRKVQADFNQDGWTIAHAVDANPKTAWGIYPQVGKSHQAIFTLAQPIADGLGVTLLISLRQTHGTGHVIGRFRLSTADTPEAGEVEALPEDIAADLEIAQDRRTLRQRQAVAVHYLSEKLEREWAALPQQNLIYCGTSNFAADGSFRPSATPRQVYRLVRGEIRNRAEEAHPGALSCIEGVSYRLSPGAAADDGERRAALARWLSDRQNGLIWRSIANRVWQYHFGRGLVDTPNDFGRMGSPPSHPELLEWLAATLRDGAGSIKSLDRLIVTSAVYRQSSHYDPAFAEIDVDNRGLWRMNRARLDAESIHDAVLVISDRLDQRMGGPSVKQFIQTPGIHVTPNVDYAGFDPDNAANNRRGVYRFLFRTLPDPLMETLDCPDGSQTTPIRGASVTALQALALLHDKFIVRQTEHIAKRIEGAHAKPADQVAEAYRLILGRRPTAREQQAVGAYVARNGLANACRFLINSSEFIFVD